MLNINLNLDFLTPGHWIEIIVILLIILRQIHVFIKNTVKIKRLKDLNLHSTVVTNVRFPYSYLNDFKYKIFENAIVESLSGNTYEPNDEDEKILTSALLYSDVNIEESQKIIKELNTYMLKNDQHMINFNIIRDIIDRNYQVLDEEITESLPTPLFLGLAATMLGIIFGLFGIFPIQTDDIASQIGPLLTGVAIAMTSSAIGVILTTILTTVIYKKAKKEAEEEKNLFFSQLQADLLPELLRKDETGIQRLNRNLNRFAKVAATSIKELTSIAHSSAETLKIQTELINRVDEMNVRKISKTNLEIFNRLEKNLNSFESFSNYWERLTQSLNATNDLTGKLHALVNRFNNLEDISNNIHQTLRDYQNTMRFFTAHVEKIEEGGDLAIDAVAAADQAFKNAIEQLAENTQKRIDALDNSSSKVDSKLKEIGEELAIKLKEATDHHVSTLTNTYEDNTPEFKSLNKLELLPKIQDSIEVSSQNITIENTLENQKLMNKVDRLENALIRISESLDENQKKTTKKSLWAKVESVIIILVALFILFTITYIIIDLF